MAHRSDKAFDISIAGTLGLVQFVFDMIVGIVLQIFQREVFQLALQPVESQLVSQGRIEIVGFHAHLATCLVVLGVANLSHQVHTVGNHDEDDAHVFCKRQQQVAEILALYHRVLLVEFTHTNESADDGCHSLAKLGFYLVGGLQPSQDAVI